MTDAESPTGPLAGVRVLECCWVMAGPICGRTLADYGAEVIKVESFGAMDNLRVAGPWLDQINTAPDGSAKFDLFNRNKRSITLNLRTGAGRDLFLDLVRISDVVIDNFSAGVMRRLGLGYDVLAEANPKIIMAEISGFGQTGPYRAYVAHGPTVQALSGFYELTKFGSIPMNTGYTYADFASGIFSAFVVGSALVRRELTGLGEYLDISQFEIMSYLLSEAIASGDASSSCDEPSYFQGTFLSLDEDRWCIIRANDSDEFERMLSVFDVREPKPVDAAWGDYLPKDIEMTVAEALARTLATLPLMEVLSMCAAIEVECAPVQSISQLMEQDEHLASRHFWKDVPHFLGKSVQFESVVARLSRTPGDVRVLGPTFGGDNGYVFRELLGLSPDQYSHLMEEGVIE